METTVRGILIGQQAPSDIVVREGEVVSVTAAGPGPADIGSATAIIGPTLFDVQVNGLGGIDLHNPELVPEDIARISDMLARWGVSRWVPTLVTGEQADLERECRIVVEALEDQRVARAVAGLHFEGPYISPEDGPRGAHPRGHVRRPDIREFDRLLEASGGRILYTTVAPEIEGAIDYIKAVVARGVAVSLGHHNAGPDAIAQAVDAGARLCTHLGNGLASTIPRHVNPLWPQLADDRLTASFIPDLEHLPAPALKTFVRAKGPERVVFTSDCVHIAGLKPGKYAFGGGEVELLESGRICLRGTDLLAGSSLMLLHGLVNATQVTDMSMAQAFASATTIPAKLLGLDYAFDLPTVGSKADFVVFDIEQCRQGSGKWQAAVHGVFVNGDRKA